MPPWLPRLPGVGYQIAGWWQANLSDPQMIHELFGRIFTRIPAKSASRLGGEVAHRLIIFGFTLLTLFFLFRDGAALSRQLLDLSHRVLGPRGEQVARHMIAAVHGTVTGLVLVGLAEGVLLGFAYVLAGLPHPVPIAALTGVLAVIPFGAPVAFCAAGLYLLAQGSTVAAATVVGFGFLVVFVADHFVRPFLIGGAARLPFLWVLLGILGGLETFGLLGLFLGPVVMAALVSLWREWIKTLRSHPRRYPPSPRRGHGPSGDYPPRCRAEVESQVRIVTALDDVQRSGGQHAGGSGKLPVWRCEIRNNGSTDAQRPLSLLKLPKGSRRCLSQPRPRPCRRFQVGARGGASQIL